ncbi:methyltransferase family protein [Nocardia pseudobrasiliensis]|uniref:Methyltransferase family protein n=2 Tax=Nocardia pseudobrasiliensis TaxID=45979 RepID=A0A370HKR0_9NOCA|nr:methyltransferase family protein [Nocardia pseudobrasiliensis]
MSVIRSQRSVREFYRKALTDGADTAERLDAPVCDRFAAFVNALDPRAPQTALELGYGRGTYAIALACLGFHTVAVDQIPAEILRTRIADQPELAQRLDIVEQRIENYDVRTQFGIVVARNVLHYLGRRHVRELLTRCIQSAPAGAGHYLEVFTDIERTDRTGRRVVIEGEAAYTAAEFRSLIDRLYHHWEGHLTVTTYSENNSSDTGNAADKRKYFRANRIIVTARHTAPIARGVA